MPTITPLLDQTFTYPNLEHTIAAVASPAVAVRIKRIAYRAGYLPNYSQDQATFEQIIQIGSDSLVADTVKIWIAEGLQLVTFPVNDAYSLRLEFPAWYQEIELEIKQIDDLTFAPGSSGQTSQAGLNAILAQLNTAIAQKADALALATKADVSALLDLVSTDDLIAGLSLKADQGHIHNSLYYSKLEVDAIIAAIPPPAAIAGPQFSINFPGDPSGLFYWLGTNQGLQAWVNPHTSGQIQLTASSFSGSIAALVDRANADTRTEGGAFNPWIRVNLLNRKIKLSGYLVRNRVNDGFNMRSWWFRGSNDGVNWTQIDYQNGGRIQPNDWRYIPLSLTQGYQFFEIQQDSSAMGGESFLCLGELELYGDLV